MGDTRIVSQYELNDLSNAVESLSRRADSLRSVISSVHSQTDSLEKGIDEVKKEFYSFRLYDEQQKELARAKTQIVSIRQQVHEQFGMNDDVRQYLTGILEATDVSLVRNNIITNCTEKLMISCPRYWLAPCLVAIAAWINNDKNLSEKALKEALNRDDEKTSLLFALVCRRLGRLEASTAWLERYLLIQDPHKIERKMVTVLDAYSNGLFGAQSRVVCGEKIKNWIEQLADEPGFIETQQNAWEESMLSMVKANSIDSNYPYSAKYSKNWLALSSSYNDIELHQTLLDYFCGIFDKDADNSVSLNIQLDELLENFVTSYDNEELDLRREERLLELIIEERGRRKRAESRFEAEQKALDEVFDFAQLLTSAAMHADIIKASVATQRLSIALSKQWVLAAYDNVTLAIRQRIPQFLDIVIDDWQEKIVVGNEENELQKSLEKHFNQRCESEKNSIQQDKTPILLSILFAAAGVYGLLNGDRNWWIFMFILAIGFVIMWFTARLKCESLRTEISEKYKTKTNEAKEIVRALCAERVDYVKELSEKESISEKTIAYMKEIEVGQYILSTGQRNVRNEVS